MNPIEHKNHLLKELGSGALTMDQFLRECALWAIDTLDTMVYLNQPEKPSMLVEYECMDLKEKSKVKEDFWHLSPIVEYMKKKSWVDSNNHSNREWLKECVGYLSETDDKEQIKIKLGEFGVSEPTEEMEEVKELFQGGDWV